MNNYEFYGIALNNVSLFIVILLLSLLTHYLLFKTQVSSVLDPYFLAVFSSAFCATVVFLLYLTNYISFYLFASYISTQIAFILGFYVFRKPKLILASTRSKISDKRNHVIAFYFFSFIYLISQVLIYILKGIPLFMESRLETFASGGGTGIIGRVSDVSSVFSLYAFFSVLKIDRFRIGQVPKYIVLLLIFITYFLSGGKSNFLVVLEVFWCYVFFARVKGGDYMAFLLLLKRNIKYILAFSLIVVTVIIIIQSNTQIADEDDRINPLIALSLRFIHSGDIYWYAYPNNIYLEVPNKQWFAALFNDTLGLLRIMDWDSLPEAIGITFKNIHHPSDIPQGPNARHNIFGLIYYGFIGSIIFSFFIGVTISFVRNKLPKILPSNLLGGFVFTYLMYKMSSFDSDPMLTITYLNNLVFIFPVLYIMYLFVVACFNRKVIN